MSEGSGTKTSKPLALLGRNSGLKSRARKRLDQHVDRRVERKLKQAFSGAERSLLSRALTSDAFQDAIRAEVTRQLTSAESDRDFTLSILLGDRAKSKRTLNRRKLDLLTKQIREITGVTSPDVHITHAFRSLLDAEARGLGRIAGAPYNILGKLVVPPLLSLPEGDVLEIGTLHGIFAPTLIRSLRRQGQFRSLTVIDPFTGRQMQGGENLATDVSGVPVVEEIARWNFRELGLTESDVRIVNGFSTDETIRAQAADRRYSLVIIDGDHFEDGVAQDLRWVENVIAPGGVAVLDDYGDKKWPGVEAATTKYLAESGSKMKMRGVVSTSAYLQLPPDA